MRKGRKEAERGRGIYRLVRGKKRGREGKKNRCYKRWKIERREEGDAMEVIGKRQKKKGNREKIKKEKR